MPHKVPRERIIMLAPLTLQCVVERAKPNAHAYELLLLRFDDHRHTGQSDSLHPHLVSVN